MPLYDEEVAAPTVSSSETVEKTSNPRWLLDAQDLMKSVESKEIRALRGVCYNAWERIACKYCLKFIFTLSWIFLKRNFPNCLVKDEKRGMNNPDAVIFADAFRSALDFAKHGNRIVVPERLLHEIKNKRFHKYLSTH